MKEIWGHNLGLKAVARIIPLCRVSVAQKRDVDHEEEEESIKAERWRAWGDITGVELIAEEVMKARQKEIGLRGERKDHLNIAERCHSQSFASVSHM